ncbi:hypothetical protein BJ742DRAFT_457794 [Cladochytrium replicatum]|nr:hypothetical protein BJ742DRAFT_457794 [Cladochytrium replicatum]
MANGRLIQYFCVALLFFACNPVPVSAGGFGFFKRNATDVKNDVPLKPSSARKAPPPQPAPPVNYTVAPTGVVVAAKGSASGVNGKSNSPSSLSTSKGTGTYGEPKRPALPVPTEYPQVLAEMTNQVITDGNFTTLTEGIWLVQLYAPWCHHSRKLQTIWPDIVKSLHSKNTSINFAKVDGTKDTKAAAFFEIKGYPTIKFIQNGSVWTYREQIIVDHVINFVQEGWRQQLWYNRPKSWSIWFKVQLDIFNALMGYKFFWERQLLAFETSFRSMFILLGLLGAGMFFVNDKLGGQNTGINVPAMDNEIIAGAAVENAGLEEFQQEQVLDGSNVVFQDNIPRDLSVLQESFASQHNDAVIIEHDKAYNDDSNQLYVDEICQPTVDSSANPALGYAHEPGASKEEHESTGISVVSMLFERSDIVTDFQTTVNISEEVVSSDQSSCMTAQREDEVTLCGEETAEQTRRAEKEDDGVSLGSCSERASVHIETGSAGTVSASEESASLREEPQSASAHAEALGTSIVEIADQIRDYLSVDTRSIRTHRSAGSPSSMFEQVDMKIQHCSNTAVHSK